jgi:CubicO group peptidase (beta-lactamase class C family)
MKKIYTLCFVFLVLTISVFAQNQQFDDVDKFVKAEMENQKIPGVALAIVKEGKISYAKGYGFANLEHQVPVKVETIFQSGSVGKQFTSAAVMLLVEDGKIDLDDKITKYFKDAPETWENITVRHLLTHTSGMTDYPEPFDYRKDYTEDDLYKMIKETPLGFQPGEKWSYSNLGYVTLGILIRKVSGKYFGDFLQERIFKPLDMKTARVISEADIIPNRAAGYVLVKGELKNQEWVSPSLNSTGDGALYLTLEDMAKWDAALYGEKLFKKTSLEQMWSPVKLNDGTTYHYGFGWDLGKVTGSKTVEHGGAWQGFKSFITRYLEEKTTIIVFANAGHANISKLAQGIAESYDSKFAPIRAEAIEDKEPKVTELAKTILRKLTDGTVEKDVFNTEAQKAIYPKLSGASEFLKTLGKALKFELLDKKENNDIRQYKYRVVFENNTVNYFFFLDKEGKISGLGLQPE